jgi:hypothetical protein
MFWHHVTGVFHARQRTPSWSQEAQTYKYKYHKFLIAVYKFQFIYFQIDIMVTLPLSDGGGCGLFTLLWKFRGRTVVAESQSLDRATPHKWGSKNPDVNSVFQGCWSVNFFGSPFFDLGSRAERVNKDPSHSVPRPDNAKERCRRL